MIYTYGMYHKWRQEAQEDYLLGSLCLQPGQSSPSGLAWMPAATRGPLPPPEENDKQSMPFTSLQKGGAGALH